MQQAQQARHLPRQELALQPAHQFPGMVIRRGEQCAHVMGKGARELENRRAQAVVDEIQTMALGVFQHGRHRIEQPLARSQFAPQRNRHDAPGDTGCFTVGRAPRRQVR